jgi:hypothetical protein
VAAIAPIGASFRVEFNGPLVLRAGYETTALTNDGSGSTTSTSQWTAVLGLPTLRPYWESGGGCGYLYWPFIQLIRLFVQLRK